MLEVDCISAPHVVGAIKVKTTILIAKKSNGPNDIR